MEYSSLYVFYEGPDDRRFLEAVLHDITSKSPYSIHFIPYAQTRPKKTDGFVRSIRSMPQARYVFLADMNASPCISRRKRGLKRKYKQLQEDRIAIVQPEIEAWFLAGLSDVAAKKMGAIPVRDFEKITKERFESLRPKKFTSRIDFMQELLRYYAMDLACKRSKSFRRFWEKFIRP